MIACVTSNACEGWYLIHPSYDWLVRAAFARNSEGCMVVHGLTSLPVTTIDTCAIVGCTCGVNALGTP